MTESVPGVPAQQQRHAPDHDVWLADGRCDALVTEPDGSLTRCGYRRSVVPFDLTPDLPPPPEPALRLTARGVIVGTIVVLLGVLIALDWLAFVLVVTRSEADPNMATAFLFRVGASALYGAAVVWLWRRA